MEQTWSYGICCLAITVAMTAIKALTVGLNILADRAARGH
jgi:hypothetical protein